MVFMASLISDPPWFVNYAIALRLGLFTAHAARNVFTQAYARNARRYCAYRVSMSRVVREAVCAQYGIEDPRQALAAALVQGVPDRASQRPPQTILEGAAHD
jgi:hypothetical protein